MKTNYLFFTVFISGMTSLAVELAAARLLGNYFGTSNLVWACIIGLILIYLSVGYYLGGIWADRSPRFSTFYQILAWAGLLVGLIPIASRPVLRFAADAFDNLQMGILFGSFIAVVILFILPVSLLGTASPFAIRLAITDSNKAGKISGRIYAISTLGSFIGTFLPTLLLIPTIGTYRTFLFIGGLLILCALAGLWMSSGWHKAAAYLWMPMAILALAYFGVSGQDKAASSQVFETESAYNYIQVRQKEGAFTLHLNDGQGIHSIYHPAEPNYKGPWEQVLAAPFFNSPPVDPRSVKSMAIVGLAAGTTAHQAFKVYPDIEIDGIEIDPDIVDAGRKFFDMNDPRLNVIIQDGRWALDKSANRYQIISVDAYRPPYIPWHLTTREFFQIVHEHLTADGVMVINVGRSGDDRRLIETLGSTIQSVFPGVHVMDIPGTFNSIIFATVQPTTQANLVQNLDYLITDPNTDPLLIETLQITAANFRPPPSPGLVFSDDLAPIELITNQMVLDFIISGDMEKLR
jgi:predicted membrane-bound spermidine synthase